MGGIDPLSHRVPNCVPLALHHLRGARRYGLRKERVVGNQQGERMGLGCANPSGWMGLIQMAQALTELRGWAGHAPPLLGIVVNLVDRTRVTQEVIATLETLWGEKILGLLPRTVRVRQAIMYRQPVHRTVRGTPFEEALRSLRENLRKGGLK